MVTTSFHPSGGNNEKKNDYMDMNPSYDDFKK